MQTEDFQSRILYRDDDFLIINKLPGEFVESGKKESNIEASLSAHLGGKPLFPIHRLDTPVSGCLLFGLNKEAVAYGSRLFAERVTEKRYWAIIENPEAAAHSVRNESPPEPAENPHDGNLQESSGPLLGKSALPPSGVLVHWIIHDPVKNKSAAFAESGKGRRRAELGYRLVGRGERYLFLSIDLFTGRSHQIRAQLAAIGLHIKGDLKYGARRSERGGGIRLHGRSLSFPGMRGDVIQVCAEPPIQDSLWEAFAASAGE